MVRAPYFDKNGTKKGAWSKYEDDKLRAYIEKHGHPNWRKLPKLAGLSRCGKSCRLRWMNYLCPNVKRGNYTNEEEDLIINLHKNHGNKWSLIAGKLSGRSDNEIKNHWHTYLKKRVKQSSIVSYSSSETFQNIECDKEKDITRFFDLNGKDEAEFLQAFLSSESTSSANNKQSTFSTSSGLDLVATNGSSSQSWNDEKSGCFWTNPFLLDTCSSVSNEYLITPIDLVNMYVSSSPDQDMIMVDDILW